MYFSGVQMVNPKTPIENNIHKGPWIKSDGDSIWNSCKFKFSFLNIKIVLFSSPE